MTDHVTLAVVQAALEAAADEMFAVIRRTAMSPIIYEVLDMGTGITDAEGRLVSSGAGIPTFVGVLDKAVARLIEIHGDTIREGDAFVTNDPSYGGVTHLSDVVVALPVFHEGQLLAWAASIAHWNDVGGMVPGSMSATAQEIWQEGLRLPAVRLFENGAPIEPVMAIVAANSRQPDVAQGDLWAQVAAARRAEQRLKGLAERYGEGAFRAAIADALSMGEARARTGLATLPHGRHEIAEEQDDGSVWRAVITVEADQFVVDLTENPGQRDAPMNLSRDGSVIAAQMIFKALCDPSRFANSGSFAPLEVITRPGTIFHARDPAPQGYYFETRIRLYDMLWRCLAQALPEKLPAGHFGTIGGTVIAGLHPDTGRRFTMVEPQMGGWGATPTRDGLSAMFSASHGDTFNCPAEIAEARYGVLVEQRSLAEQAGGDGLHPGGRGLSVAYRMRGDAVLSVGLSRTRMPVWGLAGGRNGGCNRLVIQRAGSAGENEAHGMASGVGLSPGDRVLIETAGGGGWGRGT
ncbi:hydantoinase B/oxoprolinase family protein [Rubellimicrobium roseum]|uniref:Hydantoinase B/oxoprolinase family protein n=1 Tax=Rubellimicrobium roseum TaxID=687525 RepID=A0A5C4N4I0_9RHOB|nr:hydantoinase B/oxoprolinase family protein [Rubellimicrobium roseum]TNC62879.1 hydantoinase B/oxoprolinase family protein [Rubellimicrobium roseum]